MCRETLESMRAAGRDPRKGGRPPHDAVRMFKVLVLCELYALSDEQVEYQIADRLSFQSAYIRVSITTKIWKKYSPKLPRQLLRSTQKRPPASLHDHLYVHLDTYIHTKSK